MKYVNLGICVVLSAFLMAGCKGKKEVSETKTDAPQQHNAGVQAGGQESASLHSGVVLETMNSGGYTYMEIEESGEKIWIAAPQFSIKVGEKVSFSQGAWMQNFKSKTLDRTFDKILFVSGVNGAGQGSSSAALPQAGHGGGNKYGIPKSKVSEAPVDGSIKKVDGGYTVAELFANKAAIAGKIVAVRGKVVKVSRNIMGKNWIHIQDGTGSEGTNDVTFTSKAHIAEVGSTVVAKGTLAADKDFGAGYKYSVIVENSEFSK